MYSICRGAIGMFSRGSYVTAFVIGKYVRLYCISKLKMAFVFSKVTIGVTLSFLQNLDKTYLFYKMYFHFKNHILIYRKPSI